MNIKGIPEREHLRGWWGWKRGCCPLCLGGWLIRSVLTTHLLHCCVSAAWLSPFCCSPGMAFWKVRLGWIRRFLGYSCVSLDAANFVLIFKLISEKREEKWESQTCVSFLSQSCSCFVCFTYRSSLDPFKQKISTTNKLKVTCLPRRWNQHTYWMSSVCWTHTQCSHKHYAALGPGILGTFIINEQVFLLSSPLLNSCSIKVLIYMTLSLEYTNMQFYTRYYRKKRIFIYKYFWSWKESE